MTETKWTPGPWSYESNIRCGFSIVSRANRACVTVDIDEEGRYGAIDLEPNARLIAAAPDGFDAASAAYMAILQSPMNAWRVDQGMNGTLTMLRDFIAKALDRDPEDVQAEYETKARGES